MICFITITFLGEVVNLWIPVAAVHSPFTPSCCWKDDTPAHSQLWLWLLASYWLHGGAQPAPIWFSSTWWAWLTDPTGHRDSQVCLCAGMDKCGLFSQKGTSCGIYITMFALSQRRMRLDYYNSNYNKNLFSSLWSCARLVNWSMLFHLVMFILWSEVANQ